MLNTLTQWIDDRTGLIAGSKAIGETPCRGGNRWRNSIGFALAATLVVDLITGLLLSTTYSPSTASAWGSVYYITYQMDHGWMIRGIHRFGSYAAVVLGGLYLLRLTFGGLYRAPREVSWWLAVGGFLLILVVGVLGNILPWDQRGYWAAVVETTIAGSTPVVGPAIKKVILGGTEMGNQTLTRIHSLHVFVLPALLVAIMGLYAWLSIKADIRYRTSDSRPFWPGQAFRHVATAVFAVSVVVALTIVNQGYSLDAPADPSSDDYPARPEWYFLPLNQLLKEFHGREMIATMVIPGVVVTGLLALPLLARILPRRFAHVLACLFVVGLGGGAGYYIYKATARDAQDPVFQAARHKADKNADRARSLADRDGIPPEGASYLLTLDPDTRGADVFSKKCQGCHNLGGTKVEGQWAPDLKEYGSYQWVRGLLEKPSSPAYFGLAPQCGGMTEWKESSKLDAKQLDDVAAYVALFAEVPAEMTPAEWLDEPKVKDHPGRALYQKECAECHSMGDPSTRSKKLQPAPDLWAWGSDRWTARLVKHPGGANFYGYLEEEQKMPAFGQQFTHADIATLVRYLKRIRLGGSLALP